MKCFTISEASRDVCHEDISNYFSQVDWQYTDPIPSYFIPGDSGVKVTLARLIAEHFIKSGPVIVWLSEIGVWPSSEHLELFNRYRLAYRETRPVEDAPVHVFDSPEDVDAFISILFMGMAFVWGIEVCTVNRTLALTISHDEWLEIRFRRNYVVVADELERQIIPLVRT